MKSRAELLAAVLTICGGQAIRGPAEGRLCGRLLEHGAVECATHCALGCRDPAERVSEAKAHDTRRNDNVAVPFRECERKHGGKRLLCPPSALMRQIEGIEEGRISGSS
jgi:hypothetical protein